MYMQATTEMQDNGLYFTTEGVYPLLTEEWNDVEISVVYEQLVSRIGLAPRFLNNIFNLIAYIEIEDDEYWFRVDSLIREKSTRHENKKLESLIFPVSMTCKIKGSYYVFTVNNTEVCKMEFLSIPKAQAMVYAGANDTCTFAEIKEPQALGWETNSSEAGVLIKQTEEDDETQQLTLISNGVAIAKAWKTLSSLNGSYALSFGYSGAGTITVEGTSHELIEGLNKDTILFNVNEPKDIVILFETDNRLSIQEPQLEIGEFSTSYIPNSELDAPVTREESILSFPAASNFNEAQGSIYLSLIPKRQFSSFSIFETDTGEFNLRYQDGNLSWTVLEENVSVAVSLDNPLSIICKWNNHQISLIVNGSKQEKGVFLGVRNKSKSLIFTRTGEVGNIIIDDIVIWSDVIEDEEVLSTFPSPDNILLQAEFKKAIGGKGVSWFEVPVAPSDASPILVEKKDGTNMKKVSFFDLETGKYRTYNEELFLYDGESDYVEVAFNDLNEDFFDLLIRTEDGEKIGTPYKVDGKRIWFSLLPSEKALYNRKRLYVRYQVNDSYVVDYNIEAVDGYRIDFSKHDGQEKTVFQEGNRYAEPYKLATMVEMNPLMNQNHEGFLYVTNNIHKVSSFKVTVTPEHIPADGGSMSMVLIEPVDKDGNFIPVANLDVTVQHGHIHRIATPEAAEAQKRSGIYIYQYHSPFVNRNNNPRNIEENIWIIDKDSEIGMQYTFLLRPVNITHPVLFTQDNALMNSNRTLIFNYLVMYEGMKKEEDSELFEILDINQDGKITSEDIQYLESGAVDGIIAGIANKIKAWEAN